MYVLRPKFWSQRQTLSAQKYFTRTRIFFRKIHWVGICIVQTITHDMYLELFHCQIVKVCEKVTSPVSTALAVRIRSISLEIYHTGLKTEHRLLNSFFRLPIHVSHSIERAWDCDSTPRTYRPKPILHLFFQPKYEFWSLFTKLNLFNFGRVNFFS